MLFHTLKTAISVPEAPMVSHQMPKQNSTERPGRMLLVKSIGTMPRSERPGRARNTRSRGAMGQSTNNQIWVTKFSSSLKKNQSTSGTAERSMRPGCRWRNPGREKRDGMKTSRLSLENGGVFSKSRSLSARLRAISRRASAPAWSSAKICSLTLHHIQRVARAMPIVL